MLATSQGNFQNQENTSAKRPLYRGQFGAVLSVQIGSLTPYIFSLKNILSKVLTEGNKKIESTAWNRLLWVHTAVTS